MSLIKFLEKSIDLFEEDLIPDVNELSRIYKEEGKDDASSYISKFKKSTDYNKLLNKLTNLIL